MGFIPAGIQSKVGAAGSPSYIAKKANHVYRIEHLSAGQKTIQAPLCTNPEYLTLPSPTFISAIFSAASSTAAMALLGKLY
jgi:hypothetical protein